MKNASNLMNMLWPSCERVSLTVSNGLERDLSHAERASVGLHMLVCPGCRAFRRQVRALREAFRLLRSRSATRDKLAGAFLPALLRERIESALSERMRESG
ncbi:MAG: hypothetical protein P4L84_24220 [Isosphaeraceae bacterium]|nr:hypothetical protein [Isosphaeraceae bacterium]